MTTLVGTQQDFASAVTSLLTLEYDTLEAYTMAIDKLENVDYMQKLREFSDDHDRYIRQLSMLLTLHKIEFTAGPDMKQWLTKGKVMLANLVNDKSILHAMLSNEIDTNKAYDNMLNRNDIWSDAVEFLMNAKDEETKHCEWFEENIK